MTFQFAQRVSNSAHFLKSPSAIPVLGICKTEPGEQQLIEFGIEPINVWMIGRGHETFEEVILRGRGEPTLLYFAENLRVLGDHQDEIFDRIADLEDAHITLRSIHALHTNINRLTKVAFKSLHSSAAMKNRRVARRRGRAGGLAKAANAASRRQAEISDDVARKLWASRLTKKEKAAIMGITISTGDRHYGVHAT